MTIFFNDYQFDCSRAKVKVSVAIFRRKKKQHCHRFGTLFMDRFCGNFTHMFSMKKIFIKFNFQLSRAKDSVKEICC